ncbi:MAG: type II CAAX endopeptidase family protein [Oscillospiraceae bacterium]
MKDDFYEEHGEQWYENVHPNEACYTAGYGFTPSSPWESEKRTIRHQATVLAFCMVFYLFLSFFSTSVLYSLYSAFSIFFPSNGMREIAKETILLFSSVVSMALPFAVFGAFTKIPIQVALPKRRVSKKVMAACVGVSLGASVLGIFASNTVSIVLGALGVAFKNSMNDFPLDLGALIIYCVNLTLVPAVFEEIAFRGFIMQSLRRFGDGFALIISAFCFSLVHITPDRLPHTFIMGLIIGYFVLFTGSLSTGIMIHLCYNITITILNYAFTLVGVKFELINLLAQILMLLAGAGGLIYFFKNYGKMFKLRQSDTVNSESEKCKTFIFSGGFVILYIVIAIVAAGEVVLMW